MAIEGHLLLLSVRRGGSWLTSGAEGVYRDVLRGHGFRGYPPGGGWRLPALDICRGLHREVQECESLRDLTAFAGKKTGVTQKLFTSESEGKFYGSPRGSP
jgi:hypothetical protein